MADQSYGMPVSPVLNYSGGLGHTSYGNLTTTPVPITNSAAQLMRVYAYNQSVNALYLQLFDTVYYAVTVGTTVPKDIIGIPASSFGGFTHYWVGDQYYNAISAVVTTTTNGHTAGSQLISSFSFH